MNNKLNNIVCKAESAEHGAEIIKAFKALGVDTGVLEGSSIRYYYGIKDNIFRSMNANNVIDDVKVVTLQELQSLTKKVDSHSELTFPREMMVSNNKNHDQYKRLVLGIFNGCYHAVNEKEIQAFFENTQYVVKSYAFAEEITETVKMTLEQIEEKLGHKIEIIK